MKSKKNTNNLEFMKQLEYYDTELTKVGKEFSESTQRYESCRSNASRYLLILNRISFLKIKGLVNHDFVQFFQNDFNTGKTYLEWLKFTNSQLVSWDTTYPHFLEVKDKLDYSSSSIVLLSPFYYYARQFEDIQDYEPKTDDTDPKKYIVTPEDLYLIKPE